MELNELKDKIRECNDLLKEHGKTAVASECKKIFDKFPLLQEFTIKGYVPAFNDGDPCEFRFYMGEYFKVDSKLVEGIPENQYYTSDEDDDGDELGGDDNSLWVTSKYTCKTILTDIYKEIYALEDIDDDIMETAFGSNFKLIITKDKVEVEEYYCGY